MAEIELSAGAIRYEDSGGEGPVVVLCHGLLMAASLWDAVVEELGPGVRCVRPTLPLGAHRRPMRAQADLSLRGQVRLLAEFLERLELEEVTLVFNDWCGAQLLVAEGWDRRVGRLVLASCETDDNYPPGLPGRLAALSLLTAAALVVRLGQLGWVVGEVTPAASPVLVRFVRQKTVLVTTYRRNGRPVGTAVSLAVDGPGPTDRPAHRGHGQAPGGRRVPAGGPPAGRQAPTAARRAGAVDPSPGPGQDRQDGPFPADPLHHGQARRPPTDTLMSLKTHSREARMHTGKPLGVSSLLMAAIQ